jgi:hypothetical protein
LNLYELAQEITPDQLKDHQSKVIWKGNGAFAYLIRIDNEIYLRLNGSQFQLLFYWLDSFGDWVIAKFNDYKELTILWQDEKADRI